MNKDYYVVVLQENYEYYDCDTNTGQPVGDMIDHNYDTPYRYVVREVAQDEDIETFDTFEAAREFANRMKKHDTLDTDFCETNGMYEILKYNAYNDEWEEMHVYSDRENNLQEIIKMTKM